MILFLIQKSFSDAHLFNNNNTHIYLQEVRIKRERHTHKLIKKEYDVIIYFLVLVLPLLLLLLGFVVVEELPLLLLLLGLLEEDVELEVVELLLLLLLGFVVGGLLVLVVVVVVVVLGRLEVELVVPVVDLEVLGFGSPVEDEDLEEDDDDVTGLCLETEVLVAGLAIFFGGSSTSTVLLLYLASWSSFLFF